MDWRTGARNDGCRSVLGCKLRVQGDACRPDFRDGTGLCQFAKRLEDGIFRRPKIENSVMKLSVRNCRRCWKGKTGDAFMRRTRQ